jgi:serine protein kinase
MQRFIPGRKAMAEYEANISQIRDRTMEVYEEIHWEGSFQTFLNEKLAPEPVRHLRTAFQYFRDMLDHFGVEERQDTGETFHHYKLFDDPIHGGKKAVFGLDRTVEKLVNYIRAAAAEEGKERIFVLAGPVGTAKTTLIDLMARGLEAYSRTPEGAVYSVAWLFPRQIDDEGGRLGFVRTGPETDDVFARVRCQMHDNPLFIIPRALRQEFLEKTLAEAGFHGKKRPVLPRKILEGELCYNCTQIYEYLLRRFKGDWTRIIERVSVQRIHFSELSGVGVSKIMPEGNVETSSSIISFDDNYKALSMILSDINLVKFNGKYVAGNRGLVHYSDIFKKPVIYLQHLLSAVEEHRIDFGEVGADIDVVLVGTSNMPEFQAFHANPLSHGIRSRMRKIEVPYLLNFHDEERIYDQGLLEVSRTRHVAPHTTRLAALWAVLTRLMKSKLVTEDADLKVDEKELLEKLTPMQKALLYAGEIPRSFSREARRALSPGLLRRMRNEHTSEGLSGISPRIIQNLFADICEGHRYPCLNPFEFFAEMRRSLELGTEIHDNLPDEGEDAPARALAHLESVTKLYKTVIKEEIETAVTDVSREEISAKIHDYIANVKAFLRKENITDTVSGTKMPPNEELMRYVESRMGIEDKERGDFRFKILSRASGAVRDGGTLDIDETYADLMGVVRSGIYAEKKGSVNWEAVLNALEKKDDEKTFAALPEWTRSTANVLVDNLTAMYGYCPHCTRDVVAYALANRLLE